jgi:hypothetical protein
MNLYQKFLYSHKAKYMLLNFALVSSLANKTHTLM